ncbi:hypothetical protein D9M69_687400 [compost metagenome]
MSSPSIITSPASGLSSPLIACISVDFPLPDLPTIATLTPFGIVKLISSSALKEFCFFPYVFVIRFTSIIALPNSLQCIIHARLIVMLTILYSIAMTLIKSDHTKSSGHTATFSSSAFPVLLTLGMSPSLEAGKD